MSAYHCSDRPFGEVLQVTPHQATMRPGCEKDSGAPTWLRRPARQASFMLSNPHEHTAQTMYVFIGGCNSFYILLARLPHQHRVRAALRLGIWQRVWLSRGHERFSGDCSNTAANSAGSARCVCSCAMGNARQQPAEDSTAEGTCWDLSPRAHHRAKPSAMSQARPVQASWLNNQPAGRRPQAAVPVHRF